MYNRPFMNQFKSNLNQPWCFFNTNENKLFIQKNKKKSDVCNDT